MTKLSRRDFLKTTAAGVGALSLAYLLEACSTKLPETAAASDTPIPSPVQSSAAPPSPMETLPASTEVPSTSTNNPVILPDLVVAREGEPEELVRRAVTALGGMDQFVPRGSTVIVKPNICVAFRTYEYAATTNPWVVGALVKLCFEAGAASVKVMDNPFNGTQEQA
jgi:hypothetical protein